MRRTLMLLIMTATLSVATPFGQTNTLDIYYIDTEGGQSTLFVLPSNESVLVDTGNSGTRDPGRIMEAANAAGVKKIDYLVVTHYHGDHIGGYPELSKRIPIARIVDHGPTSQPEQKHEIYDAAVAKGPHIVPKPGDILPVSGVAWTFVSVAGRTFQRNMENRPGAGRPNPYCADFKAKDAQGGSENGQSTSSVIEYGRFRTVDFGDLLWNVEGALMCPINRIGNIDVYLTTHHGLDLSNSKVAVWGLRPRVAIMNNGTTKGGQTGVYEAIEGAPGLEDLWQLHWSYNGLLEHNTPSRFIANIDDNAQLVAVLANESSRGVRDAQGNQQQVPYPHGAQGIADHSPAYWIKVSAQPDGSFTVSNSRNGFSKTYEARN
jgi:competence protein ComEC